MDLFTLIIGIVALLCFIVPIAFFKRSQRKKSQKLLADFRKAAAGHNISIADVWDNRYCIGIDTDSHHLLYAQQTDDSGLQMQTIALADVAKCRTISNESPERGGHSVHLELTLHNLKEERMLNVYNANRSTMEPADAVQLANKWADIINRHSKG